MKYFGNIKTNGILFLFLFFAIVMTGFAFLRLKPVYEGFREGADNNQKPKYVNV